MKRTHRAALFALAISSTLSVACGDGTDGGSLFEPTSTGSGPLTTGGPDPGETTGDGEPDPSGGDDATTSEPDPTAGDSTSGGTTSGGDSESGTTGPNLCGNGVIDPGEECDGTEFADASCTDYTDASGEPFTGGQLSCSFGTCLIMTTACNTFRCGDGVIQDGEQCDGPIGSVFDSDCFFAGLGDGEITCSDECTFDTSQCVQCGDGQVAGSEQCDGGVGAETCESRGFDYGSLACGDNCNFDTSGCAMNTCGDGVRLGAETCDCGVGVADCTPEQTGGETCASVGQGVNFGSLRCGAGCDSFDFSACSQCGNGVREGSEPCDGGDVGGATCIDAGFLPGVTGSVSCNADCSFNTNNCNGTRCDAAEAPPADGSGACGTDWTDGGAGCNRTCTSDACSGGLACPAGRSCDVDCVDASSCDGTTIVCDGDHSCDVTCTGVGACSNATIDCPAGADCHVTCDATNGCNGATVNCPAGNFECTVDCRGAGSCANVDLQCGGGPCRIDCDAGSNACGGTDVACGQDACQATCAGDSAPNMACGSSCGCVTC